MVLKVVVVAVVRQGGVREVVMARVICVRGGSARNKWGKYLLLLFEILSSQLFCFANTS